MNLAVACSTLVVGAAGPSYPCGLLGASVPPGVTQRRRRVLLTVAANNGGRAVYLLYRSDR